MVPLRQYIAVVPWLIYVLAHISLTRVKSRHLWLPRYDETFTTPFEQTKIVDLNFSFPFPIINLPLQNSSSYFLGDSKNESLQRIYGISFPDKKKMAEYKLFLAEAAKRDHRKIGKEQELFFFNDLSPGSCFFLPHGTRIYNSLVELMRVRYIYLLI